MARNAFATTLSVLFILLLHGGVLRAADAPPAPPDLTPFREAVRELPAEPPAPTSPALKVPTSLAPDQTQPLNFHAQNRAVNFELHSARIQSSYGPLKAPPGQVLLVLDTEWENHIPLTLVYNQKVPTSYKIPIMGDHIYVVADGKYLGRLLAANNDIPGHLPVRDFNLARIGDTARGNLVFAIPAGEAKQLELRYYDFAQGHFTVPIVSPAQPIPADKPTSPPVKNEVIEAGCYGLTKAKQYSGQTAPPGMEYVIVDMRARSVLTTEADATAFDPKAPPGRKIKIGTVADWTEARSKYLTMVVDGEYGYTPLPGGSLTEAPRFLPDIPTGGTVAFLVPANAKSLELRCDFPNAKTPDGKILHPSGLLVELEGKRPSPPSLKPLAKIDDDVFTVNITNQQTGDSFAGAKADSGKRFVILDVTVANRGSKGEFFQTHQQLKLATSSGQQIDYDKVTTAGLHPPAALLWIPPGQRRAFEVAYQLDGSETQPRLAYSGVSKAQVVDLPKLAPMSAPAVASAAPENLQTAAEKSAPPDPHQPSASNPRTGSNSQAPGSKQVADASTDNNQPSTINNPPSTINNQQPAFIDVDGKKFPAQVPIHPDLKPNGLAGVGLTPEQVNAAIDKGSAFLWQYIKTKDLKDNGKFGSDQTHVLAALALVHSGAQKKFPEFDAALRKYLASFDPNENGHTYQVGLYCMLVEAYGDPTYLPKLKSAAQWIIETQGPKGSWAYGMSVDPKIFASASGLRVLQVEGGRPLDGSDVSKPIERQTPLSKGADGDNSNTQYALLGLSSASRGRVTCDPIIWKRSLAEQELRQSKDDGGWAYNGAGGSYGSMTSAGICDLAVISHALGQDKDPAIQQRLERGLAWLSAHFSVTKHPNGSDGWLYYYLYSLERVGRILDTEFIGDHEWYPQGAQALVGTQKADGSWVGTGEEDDPRLATSFALLFLTRATASLESPKYTGPGTLKTDVLLPAGRKLYIILDASGSMLDMMGPKAKFDIAKDAVKSIITALPANSEVALRVYGYRLRAIDPGADEDTKLLIPMGPLDKEKMFQLLAGLRARGKTPLTLSLDQALGEIPEGTADSPVTVLLLTDGGEDTFPRKNPVAAAAKYAALPNVRLRIVGFDINRNDWSQQLQAMAVAAHGQYLPAAGEELLMQELRSAVFDTPDGFTVTDQKQQQVAAGKFGDSITLPAGKYDFHATYAGRSFDEPIWINAGTATAVTFDAAAVTPGAGAPIPPGSAPSAAPAPSPAPPAQAPAAAPRFCTHCGAPLPPGAKFCPKCGTPVPGA